MPNHTHRPHTTTERGWNYCITPDQCAAKPERQSAHGNIVRIDTCRCGATRESEVNCWRTNRGAWKEARNG